ncbi:hypothetical protein PTTG_06467 [Puccinia triticina 1-1 BBBD Race 1]|uniref:HAT C-terminal dimerisation domain-containing protein n=1 Tax=Puccinia triticina (isolate 1-1 / race 1 (BBBD)) TaxID=630390 RepID=A0A180GHR3_PUCT1|nr:hypothetical protein PTTG_06467 [Puccinia triticina 1-1 BBBD Race 1]
MPCKSAVLHPSFKDKYFKLAHWEPNWIEEAIWLTREMSEAHYKPSPQPTSSRPHNPVQKKPQTGVLAGLIGASEAQGGNLATDPLTIWLTGGLSLKGDGKPVDPLKWWIQQGRSRNMHKGLLQMALDVLSCPG